MPVGRIPCRMRGVVRLNNTVEACLLKCFNCLNHVKFTFVGEDLVELLESALNTAEMDVSNPAGPAEVPDCL